jgi:hypothetical protein
METAPTCASIVAPKVASFIAVPGMHELIVEISIHIQFFEVFDLSYSETATSIMALAKVAFAIPIAALSYQPFIRNRKARGSIRSDPYARLRNVAMLCAV